jgi:hypothetical protein
MRTIALVLVLGGLTAGGPARAAAVETCQGKDATIVQSGGTANGTSGDDVIVARTGMPT